MTENFFQEEKPKRGKGAPKSPTKAKKSFEESLLSGDEAPQPATPGRRGRSRDLSKTEETKPIETEAAEPVEATPETGKRPTRTRHPPKVENEVVVTPQRSLRTRGASASETLATTASVKDTPTKRKAESTPTPAKKQGKKGRKKQSDDPYDFDRESDSEKTPIGPLRHVSVARTSFGEVKFTKAPTPQPTAKGSKVTESS